MKQLLQKTLGLRAWMMVAMMVAAVTGAWADTYKLTIDASSFNTTSYAANNNEKTSNAVSTTDGIKTFEVKWTSDQVMKSGNNMQWQKSKGIIYNSTNLGKITDVTVTSTAGSYTTYYGTSVKPTSTSSNGDGFFQIKVGTATGTASKVEVTFIIDEDGEAEATTTTISAIGISNTDIYSGTEAGILTAIVKDASDNTISGAAVTWESSREDVATIDEGGTVTLVGVGTTTITATYAGISGEYKSSSNTYELTVTDSTPIPTHTVTFSINGDNSNTAEVTEGESITFPTAPADISGKEFMGWVTSAIDGVTNDAQEFVTSATMGNADVIYYAVYAYKTAGMELSVEDILNNKNTIGESVNSYKTWSNKTGKSGAVYAGQSGGDYYSIQLRSNNNNSGIITTASGGKATKVTVTWNESTVDGRTLNVYGNSKAYSAVTDLYDTNKDGTLLGTIVCGTSTELSITGDYEYIGFRSASGAMYIAELDVEWKSGTPDTYSDYCTTVVAATVARPEITVEENPFFFSTTATITCGTDGATIYYRYSEDDEWTEFSEALNITSTTTIYAKAVKGNDESSVTSVTATKNLAVPTVAIDATGITNTNVYVNTEAGYLSASVTYNDNALDGVTVTWSGNNDGVATIDAETGAVTLVAAGSVTFTATYAGNADYSESTATYEMTVTSSNPNAPGTENNPYSVAEARAAIDAGTGVTGVYARGRVSEIVTVYNEQYGNITYNISADGTTASDQLQVYRGKSYNGDNFSSADDIQVGDVVAIYGNLTKHNDIYEFAQGNQLVSRSSDERSDVLMSFDPYLYSIQEVTDILPDMPELHKTKVDGEPIDVGPIVWSSSDENIAMIDEDGGNYRLVGGLGEVEIIASFAGNEDYKPASASFSFTVVDSRPNPNLAFAPLSVTTVVGVDDFEEPELTYAEGFDGTVTYASSNTNVAEVDAESGQVTIKAVGTTTITASSAATDNFAAGEASYTLTVNKAPASLPFAFDGGRNDIANTVGLMQDGLGSDYNNKPYLKFDGTDDYLILAFNERPGTLTFDIKGNSFSGGTFNVQTSEDGVTYTDLETYTELGNTQNENFEDLGENIRYIKWIYTEKSSGNVALGNITLAKYVEPQPAQEYELSWSKGENVNEIFVFDNDETVSLQGSGAQVLAGNTVYVSVSFNDGYELDQLTVSAGETPVDVTEIESGVYYSFVMPAAAVEIYATAKVKIEPEISKYTYELVEDASTLTAGDVIIIANGDATVAMGSQTNNNRAAAAIVTENNNAIVSANAGVQPILLEGNADGWYFYVEKGYLYAASSSSNYLRTEAEADDNAKATIGIRDDGNANITFQGTNSRNTLCYNSSNNIFSCYSNSNSQNDVQIYRLVSTNDYSRPVTSGSYGTLCLPNNAIVEGVELYNIAGKTLDEERNPKRIVLESAGVQAVAGQAYIFKAISSELKASYVGNAVTETKNDNGFIGSLEYTPVEEGNYILYEGSVRMCGTGCSIGANRAYIDMSQVKEYTGSEASVKMLSVGDIVVGIAGIGAEGENGSAIYNIAGQRVQKVVRGLYIVDGKKVLVK